MTVKQKQCLLAYLGYDPGIIDGIDGKNTQAALDAFRSDYGVGAEGLVGAVSGTVAKLEKPIQEATSGSDGTFWDEIEFFVRNEFRCQCGGKYCNGFPVEPEEAMVRTVDAIRKVLGVPVRISSGIRCQTHNANVGGVSNSQHRYGKAADLHANVSPAKLKAAAEQVMGNTGGIGLYSWGIHVDTGKYSRWNG